MSSYDKENKYYRVIYEDDDSEEYTVSELAKLIEDSNFEETSTPRSRSRGRTGGASAKPMRSTGGHITRTRDSNRTSTSRKPIFTKEPMQRTTNKARLPPSYVSLHFITLHAKPLKTPLTKYSRCQSCMLTTTANVPYTCICKGDLACVQDKRHAVKCCEMLTCFPQKARAKSDGNQDTVARKAQTGRKAAASAAKQAAQRTPKRKLFLSA